MCKDNVPMIITNNILIQKVNVPVTSYMHSFSHCSISLLSLLPGLLPEIRKATITPDALSVHKGSTKVPDALSPNVRTAPSLPNAVIPQHTFPCSPSKTNNPPSQSPSPSPIFHISSHRLWQTNKPKTSIVEQSTTLSTVKTPDPWSKGYVHRCMRVPWQPPALEKP